VSAGNALKKVTADSVITASYVPRGVASADNFFLVNRFDLHGSPVAAFGLSGSSHSSFGDTFSDQPRSIILTKRGVVLAGDSFDAVGLDFGAARLQYEHIFQSAFE
jgi:hypothetical protein